MLLWLQPRLQEVAEKHTIDLARYFQVDVSQFQSGTMLLLERSGYQPVRYFYEMVRPTLENIPDFPLPDGLEMRPAKPEHYRLISASIDETSQDEWGYKKPTDDDYQDWITSPHFQPNLWQIAWDTATNQVCCSRLNVYKS